MKFGSARAASVIGVEGRPVLIEAALLSGLPAFTVVGLPDAAVTESRERIRSAFAAAGVTFPQSRMTVNLSPADTHKSGTGFDLGIAVAKKNTALLEKINHGLAAIKADGQYAEIYKKWFGKEPPKEK